MSPGRVNPGSEASARLEARPIPVSSIPPHQTGIPRSRHVAWMRRASSRPPPLQRLLDEKQTEVIDRLEHRPILKGVGGVGVHLKRQVGEPLADGANLLHVPARPGFHFSPSL